LTMTLASNLDVNIPIKLIMGEIVDILNLTEQSVTGSGGGGGSKIDTDYPLLSDPIVHGEIKIDEIKIESSTKHIQKVFLKTPEGKERMINVDVSQLTLRKGHKIKVVALDIPLEGGGTPSSAIVAIFNQNTDGRYVNQANIAKLTEVEDKTPLRSIIAVIGVPLIGIFIALRCFWSSSLIIKALIVVPFIYAAYRIMNYYFDDKSEAYSSHREESQSRASVLVAYLDHVEKRAGV